MSHIPKNGSKLEEEYKFRKGILAIFFEILTERDIRRGVLDDMENMQIPKKAIYDYKDSIKNLDHQLRRYNNMLNHVMKSDIKGEYPFRKNTGGRPKGSFQFEERDKEIIEYAIELGWMNKHGEGKQILNKIMERYPELKTPESVRNIFKKT